MTFLCKIFFFLSIFHLIFADSACPTGYSLQSDLKLCINYFPAKDTWLNAQATCARDGGNLLSIHNAFQNTLVNKIANDYHTDPKTWLGAKDTSGLWEWSDGTPFDYQRIQRSSENGDCVYFQKEEMMWKMVKCSGSFAYFCAVVPPSPTVAPSTQSQTTTDSGFTQMISSTSEAPFTCRPAYQQKVGTCQKGWQYFPTTGFEYMVGYDLTYDAGEAFCVMQGAHLASIHSDEENDFVTNLCCLSGCDRSDPEDVAAMYIIGGKRNDKSEPAWTDGTPYDYENFLCYDKGHNTILWIARYDCQHCASGTWGWYADPTAAAPYIVCKRKRM